MSIDRNIKEAGFIIPAIDIIDGKAVRLTQGDYSKLTVYHKYPLDAAKKFEDAGLKRLHLVDLDGAKAGQVKNWKVLESIAGKTSLLNISINTHYYLFKGSGNWKESVHQLQHFSPGETELRKSCPCGVLRYKDHYNLQSQSYALQPMHNNYERNRYMNSPLRP